MTRWERLLEALGTDERDFELAHKAKFDQSPSEWLREMLAKLLDDGDDENVVPEVKCTAACCEQIA